MGTANLFKNYTYPHATSRVKDESAGSASNEIVLPLHRPCFPLRCAKGKVNKIGWYTGTTAIAEFGEATFDRFSKFYRNEQTFLDTAIFPEQGCFVFRIGDPDAKTATLVLECHVTAGIEVQMYQRDSGGALVLDGDGKPIPLLDSSNNPKKEPGIRLRHVVRAMEDDEVAGKIAKKTVTAGGETTVIYPLVDFVYNSPCEWGNRSGFRFFYDYLTQDDDIVEATKSLIFTFAAYEKPYGSDTATAFRDKYSNAYAQFVMKPDQVDADTARRISSADILENNFSEDDYLGVTQSTLPYAVNFYPQFFKEIGDLVITVETNSAELMTADGWMVDILSGLDTKGNSYQHVEIDTAGSGYVTLNSVSTYYLTGGDDGDLTDEKFEEIYRSFLSLDLIPEIQDVARYPITHIYDVGYSMDTKMALAAFIGKQEYCKVEFACQDSNNNLYSMEESISAGTAIRTRAALTPESEFHGTGACRGAIFGQAGYLIDTTVKNIIPATLWMAQKRALYHNATYMKGEPKGGGRHEVELYRDYNWTPYSPDQMQLAWENAINYFQVKSVTKLFFADLRTIYKEDSSVLVDSMFTDAIVYLKYITLEVWAKYAGVTNPIQTMFSAIKKDIEKRAFEAFAGKYKTVATPYQTNEEIQQGGIIHISTEITGFDPFRRAINDIIVKRENLTTTTA